MEQDLGVRCQVAGLRFMSRIFRISCSADTPVRVPAAHQQPARTEVSALHV